MAVCGETFQASRKLIRIIEAPTQSNQISQSKSLQERNLFDACHVFYLANPISHDKIQ